MLSCAGWGKTSFILGQTGMVKNHQWCTVSQAKINAKSKTWRFSNPSKQSLFHNYFLQNLILYQKKRKSKIFFKQILEETVSLLWRPKQTKNTSNWVKRFSCERRYKLSETIRIFLICYFTQSFILQNWHCPRKLHCTWTQRSWHPHGSFRFLKNLGSIPFILILVLDEGFWVGN